MLDIISIGECMIELYADQPLAEALCFKKAFAGDAFNNIAAAQQMGSRTGFITRVGDDPFAPYLLKSWQAMGIDISHCRIVPGFNGIYFISLLPGGEREFIYYRRGSAPSTMEPSDLDEAYIANARILLTTGITQAISPSARATALRAAQIARAHGVSVAYDPNLRLKLWSLSEAQEAMAEILPYVNIALPGGPEESQTLFGLEDPQAIVASLWARGVDLVALKWGMAGCWVGVRAEGCVVRVPPLPGIEARDTTGAGDAFNGVFLHGLCHGMTPIEAARLGMIAAALKVRGRGAVASLPSREEVYAVYQQIKAWV
ncbi:MAG: sugar kinase [Anaerolineae bacterium]|nr:sugar kinase [Anaerolineae bacterium]MDW8099584.1 sugar kinase [Anaerolineae bacterium]